MKFNDTNNKNGLIQDCELLLNFPDGGISGDATLLAQFTGFINQAYLKIVSEIMANDPKWSWDDPNYTDLPRATTTLVAGQRDYTLPTSTGSSNASTLLKIIKFAVLDASAQEHILTVSDKPEAELNREFPNSGLPLVYKLIGDTIKMWPAADSSSVTLTAGLVGYYQRSPDLFTAADTVQQPGIPEPFHRLISLEASMDYAAVRGIGNIQYLQNKALELKKSLDYLMGQRNLDDRIRIFPRQARERYN